MLPTHTGSRLTHRGLPAGPGKGWSLVGLQICVATLGQGHSPETRSRSSGIRRLYPNSCWKPKTRKTHSRIRTTDAASSSFVHAAALNRCKAALRRGLPNCSVQEFLHAKFLRPGGQIATVQCVSLYAQDAHNIAPLAVGGAPGFPKPD